MRLFSVAAPDRFAKSATRKCSRGESGQKPDRHEGRVVKHASILGSPSRGQGLVRKRFCVKPQLRQLRVRQAESISTTPFMTTETPTSFEAALAELEALVSTMESGQLPLKESLAAYQRGAALLAFCQESLRDAQQQVDVLEKGVLKSFRPDGEDDA